MHKNYCILFMSKSPSKYLIDFCQTFQDSNNVYIITPENIDAKNIVHIDKENFFKDYNCNHFRLEMAKNLLMIANSDLIRKYNYFFSIEDDTFIRSSNHIINLANDLISTKSHLIVSDKLFDPPDFWYSDWEPEIKNSNTLKIKDKKCVSCSPITRYSKEILLEANDIYLKENKIYFHEIVYPLVCQKNKWTIQQICKTKYKMLLTLLHLDDCISHLNNAIDSRYDFIHPVKYGGIL